MSALLLIGDNDVQAICGLAKSIQIAQDSDETKCTASKAWIMTQ